MTTKSICPRAHGEGSIGKDGKAWGDVRTLAVNGRDAARLGIDTANLLVNSGLAVCSQGAPVGVGAALAEDDCATDGTGNWTVDANAALAFDTDHYAVATDGSGNRDVFLPVAGKLEAGKLYRVVMTVGDGTAAGVAFAVRFQDTAVQFSRTFTTTATATQVEAFFRCGADSVVGDIGLRIEGDLAGGTMELRDVAVHEAGVRTTGLYGPEGVQFGGSANYPVATREYCDASDPAGSLYRLRVEQDGGTAYVRWLYAESDEVWHLSRYRGRTVAFGCWVHYTGAEALALTLAGVSGLAGAVHGGSGWEWLEVSGTVDADASAFYPYLFCPGGGMESFVVAQPMLVYGTAIGAGNWQPGPPQEILFVDGRIDSDRLNYSSFSTEADAVDIGVDTKGRIGDGCAKALVSATTRDSGSAAGTNIRLYLASKKNSSILLETNLQGHPDDAKCSTQGVVPIWKNAYDYFITASASSTFEIYAFRYIGVAV